MSVDVLDAAGRPLSKRVLANQTRLVCGGHLQVRRRPFEMNYAFISGVSVRRPHRMTLLLLLGHVRAGLELSCDAWLLAGARLKLALGRLLLVGMVEGELAGAGHRRRLLLHCGEV